MTWIIYVPYKRSSKRYLGALHNYESPLLGNASSALRVKRLTPALYNKAPLVMVLGRGVESWVRILVLLVMVYLGALPRLRGGGMVGREDTTPKGRSWGGGCWIFGSSLSPWLFGGRGREWSTRLATTGGNGDGWVGCVGWHGPCGGSAWFGVGLYVGGVGFAWVHGLCFVML